MILLTQQQKSLLAEIVSEVEETHTEIIVRDKSGKVKKELLPLIEKMTADINEIPTLPTMPDQSRKLIWVIFDWRELMSKHFEMRRYYFD
jgi:hypothetical protein